MPENFDIDRIDHFKSTNGIRGQEVSAFQTLQAMRKATGTAAWTRRVTASGGHRPDSLQIDHEFAPLLAGQ